MRIVSGIIVGALLSTSTPSLASNSTSVDKARVAYHNLELSLFATWAVANSAFHGFNPESSLSSLGFLDSSSHVRALLLAASAFEGDLALPTPAEQTQTPDLDKALSIDKTHRDDIYGLLRSALLLCSVSGNCPNDGLLWSALDQYYPALHVIGPVADRWRSKQNGNTALVLKDRYDLPKIGGSAVTNFALAVGDFALPVLGVAQMTTWIASLYGQLVKQLALLTANSEAIVTASTFAAQRDHAYGVVSKVRGYFLLLFLTALGGDAAINAFVDYAHYFFSNTGSPAQTRDEL